MRNITIRPRWNTTLSVIILCATLIAFSGLAWLPIEAHEAFVLLSAQHMLDSGDWVVPFFNGEPRLTKPPFNYWLTAIIAKLGGSGQIEPWHGRLPSALGGIGLVLVTAYAGRKLFDARVGLLAAAISASCSGFFYYTHTARPEMLYAFLCALAIVTYLHARDGGNASAIAIYAMWATFGVATLSKGPQLPAILLAAFAIDQYWRGNGLRQGLHVLKPLRGLMLMALIAVPWWWLLHHRLGGAGLRGTQLSGTLLHVNPLANLSLYYLYRPLQLLLPWIVFLPALALAGKPGLDRKNIKLLALLVLLPAAILTFGPQKRWYYMLPALLPMSIVLAACIVAWYEKKTPRVAMAVGGLFIVCVLAFTSGGQMQRTWGAVRFSHAQLAHVMKQHGAGDTPQVTWGVTPEVFAFYTGKTVTVVESPVEIARKVEQSPQGRIVLVLQDSDFGKLPSDLRIEVLGRAIGDANDEPAVLVIASRP